MALDVALRDEAAERLAEHDRLLDAEGIAEAHDVVGKGVERPLLGRAPVAAAMAAMVVVDDLRDVGQARERRFEAGVVVAGAAVEENESGLFSEVRAIGDQDGASMSTKRRRWGVMGMRMAKASASHRKFHGAAFGQEPALMKDRSPAARCDLVAESMTIRQQIRCCRELESFEQIADRADE